MKYFLPLTFLYPRLSPIPASFIFQNSLVPIMGQALGWSLREVRHRPCSSGAQSQEEKLFWKQSSRTPCSGARPEPRQGPRGAQGWEGGSLSAGGWGRKVPLKRELFLNVTIISAEMKIRFHIPMFVNGSFESLLPSFPHFAGDVLRPIRGLSWIHEGRMGKTAFPPPTPSEKKLQGQTWSFCSGSCHTHG